MACPFPSKRNCLTNAHLDIERNTLTMCFIFVRYSLCAVTIIGIITRDGVIGNFSESLSEVLGSSPSPATHLRPEG